MRLPLVTAVLAVLNVALASAIGMRVLRESSIAERVTAAAADQTTEAVAEVPSALAPTSFDRLQSEAVFHKSRSFYVTPPSPSAQHPPPDYRFAGLMALPNRPPSAVLLNNQSNARVRVTAGDQLDGWSVAEVSAKRVLLQLGERTAEISATASAGSSGMVRVLGSARASQQSEAPRLYRPQQ
jgi:hypothetical protein